MRFSTFRRCFQPMKHAAFKAGLHHISAKTQASHQIALDYFHATSNLPKLCFWLTLDLEIRFRLVARPNKFPHIRRSPKGIVREILCTFEIEAINKGEMRAYRVWIAKRTYKEREKTTLIKPGNYAPERISGPDE